MDFSLSQEYFGSCETGHPTRDLRTAWSELSNFQLVCIRADRFWSDFSLQDTANTSKQNVFSGIQRFFIGFYRSDLNLGLYIRKSFVSRLLASDFPNLDASIFAHPRGHKRP